MHAPSALPPLTPFAVPFFTGWLTYMVARTLAQTIGSSYADVAGVVLGGSVAALLLPAMVVIHSQTVTALARRDQAAFEAARKPETEQTQPVRVYATDTPARRFMDMGNGWHAYIHLDSATPEQTVKLAEAIAGGSHNLACNRLRAIGFRDPEIDKLRPELRDRGFAVESKGRYFLTDEGIQHFREIARQMAVPHPGRGSKK